MVALRSNVIPQLVVDYDAEADVLYVTNGGRISGYGDGGEDDEVILRYAEDDDRPIGATFIGYKALNWPLRRHRLYELLSQHLKIPEEALSRAFEEAGM